uniref:Uncharacterized protein n=1 Tax=mine drainage metagenome TaxID=410659 RepID=E6Q6X5_9ZZZZ
MSRDLYIARNTGDKNAPHWALNGLAQDALHNVLRMEAPRNPGPSDGRTQEIPRKEGDKKRSRGGLPAI